MKTTNEERFAYWKELSNLVANHNFSYIDNHKYDEIISNILNNIYKEILREDIAKGFCNYLQKKYSEKHAFIFYVIEDILFEKEFNYTQSLNVPVNKKIIENALNLVSVQLTVSDYEYPSKNDYSQIISNLLFMKKQDDYFRKNYDSNLIKQKKIETNNKTYEKHVNERLSIHIVHNNNYNEIIKRGLDIWKDSKNSNLYYRIKPFEKKIKTDKITLTDYLFIILNKYIDIYDNTDCIMHPYSDYLIISLLPVVKADIFNPFLDMEFPHIANNMFYKNTFQYTDLLRHRFNLNTEQHTSFIENFIRHLTNNENQFNYIMNWLASFFQILQKSNIALVLIGDVEATDILISKVIKPIFALKKEYFCTIDDDALKRIDGSTIKDKIFYHISEISTANAKNNKTSKLVREILKFNRFTPEYAIENDEIYIFGQLVVTSSKDNLYPFLKDYYNNCTVFKVNSLDTIIKNLNIDPLTFDYMIQDDLNNFASILAKYSVDFVFATKVFEIENRYPPAKKIIDENTLNKNIQNFIDAIKSKNISYFEQIKNVDRAQYDELIHNFNEGMIARQELFSYFDKLYPASGITNNKDFLSLLKNKDTLFEQDIDKLKNKQYNKKKRYRIEIKVIESDMI
ncbi:MAG: hypothetical protein PHX13_03780 [Thiovulaceae bacterium]|nr:hypothetical protein [Sulfurimonadaceae bacterium]